MIEIPKNIIEAIVSPAYDELPNEACGLLTGNNNQVKQRHPMTNIDKSPDHFSFDPQEQVSVLKKARETGEKIIANYHSHPSTPARPSQEDIVLAFDPDITYIIVSLAGTEAVIKAFKIRDCKVTEEKIKIL
ncbi:MAG: M67 family metallopeptidase [Rikenellaceae bacterium]|nr:M67 family metallopeptidase [Rikenellaceae bacterium]